MGPRPVSGDAWVHDQSVGFCRLPQSMALAQPRGERPRPTHSHHPSVNNTHSGTHGRQLRRYLPRRWTRGRSLRGKVRTECN